MLCLPEAAHPAQAATPQRLCSRDASVVSQSSPGRSQGEAGEAAGALDAGDTCAWSCPSARPREAAALGDHSGAAASEPGVGGGKSILSAPRQEAAFGGAGAGRVAAAGGRRASGRLG